MRWGRSCVVTLAIVGPAVASAESTGLVLHLSVGGGIEHRLAPCDDPGCSQIDAPSTDVGLAFGFDVGAAVSRNLIVSGRLSTMWTSHESTRGSLLVGPHARWYVRETLWVGGGVALGSVLSVRGPDGYGSFRWAVGAEVCAGYGLRIAANHQLQFLAQSMLIDPLDRDGQQSQQRLTLALLVGYQFGR